MATAPAFPAASSDTIAASNNHTARTGVGKHGTFLFNIALVALITLGVLAYRLPLFSPGLYITAPAFDFASVTAGTTVRHEFTVRNLHPWAVTITRVQGGCGCTKGFVGREEPFCLMPFEAVQVSATLDTYGKKGATQQTLVVSTKGGREDTALVLKGTVRPGL